MEDFETIRAMMIEGMQAKNTKAVDEEETVEVLAVEGVEGAHPAILIPHAEHG